MTTSVEPVPQLAEGSANHHVKAIQGVLRIKSVQFNHLNAVLSHVMITKQYSVGILFQIRAHQKLMTVPAPPVASVLMALGRGFVCSPVSWKTEDALMMSFASPANVIQTVTFLSHAHPLGVLNQLILQGAAHLTSDSQIVVHIPPVRTLATTISYFSPVLKFVHQAVFVHQV